MGMQVRLRHALGARIVEIEARGPDRPLRLGRDAQCDVQVPSGAVLPVHALLYVHDEQWVVSKADPAAPLTVNGQPIAEPVFVNPGDMISLGAGVGGATLELDPLRTARRSAAIAPAAVRPTSPEEMAPEQAPADYEPAPADGQVAWSDDAPASPAAEEEDPWPVANPRRISYRRVTPKASESTRSNVLIAGVLIAIVLVGMAGFVTYKFKSRNARNAPRQAVLPETSRREVADEPLGTGGRGSIFDFPDDRSRTRPPRRPAGNPRPAPRNPTPAPAGPSSQSPAPAADGGVVTAEQEAQRAEPVPDNDPRKQTPEWKNIHEASRRLDADSQVRLIWACQDQRSTHPGEFEQELDGHIAGALDLLWWMRIKDLCDRRAALQAQIEKIDRDIRAEAPDSEFRAKFAKERKDREYELNSTVDSLTNDMGYAGTAVPNILNVGELDDLRRQRDAARYEKWSKRVTDHIHLRHRAPWQ